MQLHGHSKNSVQKFCISEENSEAEIPDPDVFTKDIGDTQVQLQAL